VQVFIENLSTSSLFSIIFNKSIEKNKIERIFYFDLSKNIILVKRFFEYFLNIKIKEFNFSFDELKNDNGTNIIYDLMTNDYEYIWSKLEKIKYSNNDYKINRDESFQLFYLKKSLLSNDWPSDGSDKLIRRVFILLHAINIKHGMEKIFILLDNRVFMNILQDYCDKKSIQILTVNRPLKKIIKRISLYIKNISLLKSIYNLNVRSIIDYKIYLNSRSPNIIIDQVMNFFNPSIFWSAIKPFTDQIIFVCKNHKIDQKQIIDIKSAGMKFIALSRYASNNLDVPLFLDNENYHKGSQISEKEKSYYDNYGILDIVLNYKKEKKYWEKLFVKTNTVIYGTHEKWSPRIIPAIAAINKLNGISFLWQTSYYEFPNPLASVSTDIYFCFSPESFDVELKSNSKIQYLVAVGYIFDNNFDYLKPKALEIKSKLQKKGATKIISFFDGGSSVDSRWGYGNINFEKDYKFWLEKLVSNRWLGLIIKSKKPGSLFRNLSNISELLNTALSSGRCIIIGDSNHLDKDLNTRPALAAMASDIAIHQRLDAGSAGTEAALCGIPTLMYDSYGLTKSQFYHNGQNKIVFNDWNTMWKAITKDLNSNKNIDFGIWNNIIDKIDPFSDGKAADRLNSYIKKIYMTLKQGKGSDIALKEAYQQYAKDWGKNNILKINV